MLSRWLPTDQHPQCPPSQYFHQLPQLFRARGLLPPHVPRESSSLANGCRRMFNISPDSPTSPSPRDNPLLERKRQALNHGWAVVSQQCLLLERKNTGIYPRLTLLRLMRFLFQICQPVGFCHLMLYASTAHFKVSYDSPRSLILSYAPVQIKATCTGCFLAKQKLLILTIM